METGERVAAHLAPDEGHAFWVLGGLITCKVTAEQTGGAYSLFEETVRPREGPLPRIGHREDGCFYVVEGELEFLAGEELLRAGPGSLVYVPRGTVHGFTNVGETNARILSLLTPGGTHERFFEEIEESATDRSTAPVTEILRGTTAIAEIAAKYGIEILPATET